MHRKLGGKDLIYKVTFQKKAVREKVAERQRRLQAPRQQRRLRGAQQQVEGGHQLVPGLSVRLSHSRRLKSQVTFKTDSKGVDLLDVKLSPPDCDKGGDFTCKCGVSPWQVFEPS